MTSKIHVATTKRPKTTTTNVKASLCVCVLLHVLKSWFCMSAPRLSDTQSAHGFALQHNFSKNIINFPPFKISGTCGGFLYSFKLCSSLPGSLSFCSLCSEVYFHLLCSLCSCRSLSQNCLSFTDGRAPCQLLSHVSTFSLQLSIYCILMEKINYFWKQGNNRWVLSTKVVSFQKPDSESCSLPFKFDI